MSDEKTLEELAAAFNGHQITDEEGQLSEPETDFEESAPEDQTTEDEPVQDDTPAEEEEFDPRSDDDLDETEVTEDESGKEYIPKKRFDKVYAKLKDLEREKKRKPQEAETDHEEFIPQIPSAPINQADYLEVELLKDKMPEFDPESDQYSPELDWLGAQIKKANPGITRLQAAKEAKKIASGIGQRRTQVKTQARLVKSQQADSGIATRSSSRGQTQIDPNNMSEKEMEAYLKANGMW